MRDSGEGGKEECGGTVVLIKREAESWETDLSVEADTDRRTWSTLLGVARLLTCCGVLVPSPCLCASLSACICEVIRWNV